MTAAQQVLAEAVLLEVVQQHPDASLDTIAKLMLQYGCSDANRAWVYRVLVSRKFTHKRLYFVQRQKFTELNILRYIDHIFGVCQLDPMKLKYLDESRFETKGHNNNFLSIFSLK